MTPSIDSTFSQLKIDREKLAIGLIWLFQLSGIIGISLGYKDWFIEKTAVTLILHFLLLISVFSIRLGSNLFKNLLFVVLLGYLVEWVGVNHFPLFGDYYYGENFGARLAGTPLLIGLNWGVLAFITASIAHKISSKKWLRIFLGASLMVTLDLPMERVADDFGYWHFTGGLPPIENYISWFMVGLIMHTPLSKFQLNDQWRFSTNLFVANLLFFSYFSWKLYN